MLWEQLREYFEVRFRAEKYGVPYFFAESEARQSGPRKEAVGARASGLGRTVEDLNVQVIRSYSWAAMERAPSGVCRMGAGRLSRRQHSCPEGRPWVRSESGVSQTR